MLKNTELYGGIVFSQKVLLKLCDTGMMREEAYKLVQRNALDAFNNHGNFLENLLKDKEVTSKLSTEEIISCFNLEDYLQNIEFIYKKFGI
jgi:adenylosuccinate lyase